MQESLKQLIENCNKSRRCGFFKHCDPCARLRQARFADKAVKLFPNISNLYLIRITPDESTPSEIIRIKEAAKRQLDGTPALWTVEQGTLTNKLHLNLIAQVKPARQFKAASHFVSEPIKNLREAAAYILKKEQFPSVESWSGRQFGTFNTLESILLGAKTAPILQAAALDAKLHRETALPTPYLERQDLIEKSRNLHGDYKQIAMANLPRLRAAIASLKGSYKTDKSAE